MADTLNRAYPRPDTSRTIAEEFPVSDQALVAIDADIHELFEAILGLAPLVHTHDLADVAGLIDALAGKASSTHAHALDDLTDVSGAAAAANGYVLVKTAAGWIPGSPASVIGTHQHAMTDVVNLDTALANLAIAVQIAAGTDEATADASVLAFRKADGTVTKRSWANVIDAIRLKLGAMISGSTAKSTPVDADLIGISDSAATSATKKTTFVEAWTNYFKVKADALYQPIKAILTTLGNLANASGYLSNNGAGVLSWATPPSLTLIREQVFESSGNFTPNANAKVTEFLVAAPGGSGGSGANGSGGAAGRPGSGGAAVVASGSKADVGNANLAVTVGVQGANPTTAGTPTTVGSLISAESGRRGSNNASGPATTGNSNLPEKTVYGSDTHWLVRALGISAGGAGGAGGNTNQSGGSGVPGGPGIVVVREYR